MVGVWVGKWANSPRPVIDSPNGVRWVNDGVGWLAQIGKVR